MGQTLYDGFDSLHEGMDGATPPDFSAMRYRSAISVNVTHRGGYARQRPAYYLRTLDTSQIPRIESNFLGDMFQGACAYYPDSAQPVLAASIGGRVFTIEIANNYRVNDVTPADGPDNSWLPKAWFTQVEKWLVKQNGIDPAVIYDGAISRRPAVDEFHIGTCGVYSWGRYWYALPNGREYRATDLVYGNGNRSDVLKETENTFLTGGGNFAVPGSAGSIRAMLAPALMDNALGQGPIHVFCDTAIFSCNAPIDRDTWQTVDYPIQTVTLNNNGAMCDTSTIIANSDVFYRSKYGFHSYIQARREFGDWANTPVSREVERFYRNDNSDLLQYGTGAVWDNRALFGVMPTLTDKGIVHRGLVALDFDLISTMKGKLPPAWDGLWTGLNIHALVTVTGSGKERLFAFVRSSSDELELWEVLAEKKKDNGTTPIEWIVIPRQMNFGSNWMPKRLMNAELFIKDVDGLVELDIDYRPDDYVCPVDWAEFSECATTEICSDDECVGLVNRHPQYRTALTLRNPDDECNTVANRNMRTGFKFQPIIKVRGAATLCGMRLKAEETSEAKEVSCGAASCKVHECCPIDPITYSSEGEVE